MVSQGRETLVVCQWILILCSCMVSERVNAVTRSERLELRDKALEMFDHAYNSYMTHAYPADELMPLECRGRFRGREPSRGDVDEAMGNFSLTLVDSLDSLAIMGRFSEFERAISLVDDVRLDSDLVVSVFETNIRMLGGLLGGHVMAVELQGRGLCCQSYEGSLLDKAKDLGYRLLPAFNTSTGMPHPKINLRHGTAQMRAKDTCTACAGTMVLEMAALSRLTGIPVFEEKAHKAMDYLWQQRNRGSDLMGTVIDIHNGAWVRKEAGVGAGIDSYYEYVLKAYILLGEGTYLHRFNKHYDSIMRYISKGPMMVNVDMHRPTSGGVRGFMDALLAFWPGLQVLKGDLDSAIRMHEMLYQVTQRHSFLPEAFTTQFLVHWAQHPLRPEFVESTYFLYQATGDPYYLEVGRSVLENLQAHARVDCGFAAIQDVRAKTHEDRMDSYVLAETFKYLYLLFADEEDIPVDLHDYVFTTEAHLLPLSLSSQKPVTNDQRQEPLVSIPSPVQSVSDGEPPDHDHSCPNHNINVSFPPKSVSYAGAIRGPVKYYVEKTCPKAVPSVVPRLKPSEFVASNEQHVSILKSMGIQLIATAGGKMQLMLSTDQAQTAQLGQEGAVFMQEMMLLARGSPDPGAPQQPRVVQVLPSRTEGSTVYQASSAQFGLDLSQYRGCEGEVVAAVPLVACTKLRNLPHTVSGKVVVAQRGNCMFVDKARMAQEAGAMALIVVDNIKGSSSKVSPPFQMSGDERDDVHIPVVFLFEEEGLALLKILTRDKTRPVYIGSTEKDKDKLPEAPAVGDTEIVPEEKEPYVEEDGSVSAGACPGPSNGHKANKPCDQTDGVSVQSESPLEAVPSWLSDDQDVTKPVAVKCSAACHDGGYCGFLANTNLLSIMVTFSSSAEGLSDGDFDTKAQGDIPVKLKMFVTLDTVLPLQGDFPEIEPLVALVYTSIDKQLSALHPSEAWSTLYHSALSRLFHTVHQPEGFTLRDQMILYILIGSINTGEALWLSRSASAEELLGGLPSHSPQGAPSAEVAPAAADDPHGQESVSGARETDHDVTTARGLSDDAPTHREGGGDAGAPHGDASVQHEADGGTTTPQNADTPAEGDDTGEVRSTPEANEHAKTLNKMSAALRDHREDDESAPEQISCLTAANGDVVCRVVKGAGSGPARTTPSPQEESFATTSAGDGTSETTSSVPEG